jgi:hypothetical protein
MQIKLEVLDALHLLLSAPAGLIKEARRRAGLRFDLRESHKSGLLLGIPLDALYIEVISLGVVDYGYREILYLQSPDRFGP